MYSKCLLLRIVSKLFNVHLLPHLSLVPSPLPPFPLLLFSFISPPPLSSSFSLPIPQISEGGSAIATGKLKMGDKILKVNGTDMEMATHEEAVMCLVSQEGNIELLIRHEPPPPGLQVCTCT